VPSCLPHSPNEINAILRVKIAMVAAYCNYCRGCCTIPIWCIEIDYSQIFDKATLFFFAAALHSSEDYLGHTSPNRTPKVEYVLKHRTYTSEDWV